MAEPSLGDRDDTDPDREANGVDPMAWLTDVLERIVSRRTKMHELHTLLPWNWRPPSPVDLAEAA